MIKPLDKKYLKKFGLHLKQVRQSKNLSVRDLSYNCSIDFSKIAKIENGQINITLTTLNELSKGLDVSPKDLLNFER